LRQHAPARGHEISHQLEEGTASGNGVIQQQREHACGPHRVAPAQRAGSCAALRAQATAAACSAPDHCSGNASRSAWGTRPAGYRQGDAAATSSCAHEHRGPGGHRMRTDGTPCSKALLTSNPQSEVQLLITQCFDHLGTPGSLPAALGPEGHLHRRFRCLRLPATCVAVQQYATLDRSRSTKRDVFRGDHVGTLLQSAGHTFDATIPLLERHPCS